MRPPRSQPDLPPRPPASLCAPPCRLRRKWRRSEAERTAVARLRTAPNRSTSTQPTSASRIDQSLLAMRPGSRWVYREAAGRRGATSGGHRHQEDEADRQRHRGGSCTTWSARRQAGRDHDDWYAQDSDGNVWYLGERTAEYENGKVVSRAAHGRRVSTALSRGVIMPAEPRPGLAYRQEHYAGEAEDRAKVLASPSKRRCLSATSPTCC
jgi:hypothetical protein